jgi:WD40 repeat protein
LARRAATGKLVATVSEHINSDSTVAFSPNGKRIMIGSNDTVHSWDAATGERGETISMRRDSVSAVEVSPDDPRVLPRSKDSASYDTATDNAVATPGEQIDLDSPVDFLPTGSRAPSGANNNATWLWDAATGEPVATLRGHTGTVTSVAFSPDGTRVLAGYQDGAARLWRVFRSAQELVETVKVLTPRCLILAQRGESHLGTAPPRWCEARGLWPFDDHRPEDAMSDNPRPLHWDEWLVAAWDRVAARLAGPKERRP